jgi:hypothetical protein
MRKRGGKEKETWGAKMKTRHKKGVKTIIARAKKH